MKILKELLFEVVLTLSVLIAEVTTKITTLADRCSEWAHTKINTLRQL